MDKEKEKIAIQRLQTFAPQNGDSYYLCYSGGKDSDAIRILAQLADVPHEIYHNLTSVDAPETVQYIKTIPGVIIEKARYADGTHKNMWNLIPRKKLPPTRLMRWCCAELKEPGGRGRLKITGIRWEESRNRRVNSDVVKILGKQKTTQKKVEDLGLPYTVTLKAALKCRWIMKWQEIRTIFCNSVIVTGRSQSTRLLIGVIKMYGSFFTFTVAKAIRYIKAVKVV